MIASLQLETPRLLLRPWQESDREPFAALNADNAVRAFFPSVLSAQESDDELQLFAQVFTEKGYGLFATELRETRNFIGFIGLMPIPKPWPQPIENPIEIGWRLAKPAWGQGLATEGALAVLDHAFQHLGLTTLYSMTAATNLPSQRVMEKLGMHLIQNFNHPRLPEGHALRAQVLYSVDAPGPTRNNHTLSIKALPSQKGALCSTRS